MAQVLKRRMTRLAHETKTMSMNLLTKLRMILMKVHLKMIIPEMPVKVKDDTDESSCVKENPSEESD